MNDILVLLVLLPALFHYLTVGRNRGWANADGIFVVMQTVMAVGTVSLVNLSTATGSSYALVSTIPLLIYVLASILLWGADQRAGRLPHHDPVTISAVSPAQHPTIPVLYGLSVLITVAYFVAVGYNVLLLGLMSLFGGGPTHDYTSLRLDAYSGNRYLFPGYVNQFKNAILPALSVVIIHHASKARRLNWPVTLLVATLATMGLLGTGQRGAFVVFAVVVAIFIRHLNPARFLRRIGILALVTAPPMLLSTLLLGRSASALQSASPIAAIQVLLGEIGRRLFQDNQESGLAAYEYMNESPTQWGAEWLTGLSGILPGLSGTTLASEVFEYMYGTTRGTAPPSLWGSVYYNFNWYGLLIAPVVLALLLRSLTLRLHRDERMNSLQLVGLVGLSVVLGTWVAGGPEYLLNTGAIAYVLLWFIGNKIGVAHNASAESPRRSLALDEATSTTLGRNPRENLHPFRRQERGPLSPGDARLSSRAGSPRLGGGVR